MKCTYLLILIPFLGFIFFTFFGRFISKRKSEFFGLFLISLNFCFFLNLYIDFYKSDKNFVFVQNLYNWISTYRFNIEFSLLLDELSCTMLFIIVSISVLIYLFSISYMKYLNKYDYARFFAYLNLFISSMILLVLSNNILLMYFAWEIVGVCSYLLIGFDCKNTKNGYFASKSLLITRIGDIFLFIAILMLYIKFNTLNFCSMNNIFNSITLVNKSYVYIIALFIFIGSIGKSAQFPFQVWLADAMVGPTPVSALIHSSTMITAGVYLISRMHNFLTLNPIILNLVSFSGITTILIGCFCALAQKDLKKILAYSTMSQIGYMFLSLGFRSWDAALIHLIIHGIFKALLFLSSATLIHFLKNTRNIFKMRSFKKYLPFLYFFFLIGCSSLASFPILTSGYYSKENILFNILQNGHLISLIFCLFSAFLTSIYTFKFFFIIFYKFNLIIKKDIINIFQFLPMLVLSIFSTFFGFIFLNHFFFISLYKIFSNDYRFILEFCSSLSSLLGIYVAYYIWILNSNKFNYFSKKKFFSFIYKTFYYSLGFNFLYQILFINSYNKISKILYHNFLNRFYYFFCVIYFFIKKKIEIIINGYLRWYLILTVFGFLMILSIIEKL